MAQAIWNETVIAESNDTIVVEGNHYFPPEALHQQYFKPSEETSYCGWKGTANYYDVVVDGEVIWPPPGSTLILNPKRSKFGATSRSGKVSPFPLKIEDQILVLARPADLAKSAIRQSEAFIPEH